MEDIFNKLKNDNKNTVDNLIKWMKDSKIIDGTKITEEAARKHFANVTDAKNVEFDKFKEAVSKLAVEHKKTPEDLGKILATEGAKFLLTAKVAAAASKK